MERRRSRGSCRIAARGRGVTCRAHGLLCDVAARPRTAVGTTARLPRRYFRVRLPYRRRSTPPPTPGHREKRRGVSVLYIRSRARNRYRRRAAAAITGRPVRGGFSFSYRAPLQCCQPFSAAPRTRVIAYGRPYTDIAPGR